MAKPKLARNQTITSPIIEGGAYKHKVTGETASIMGTDIDENSGRRWGYIYTAKRGPLPSIVTENTDSMLQWELTHVGSKTAATQLVNAHIKEYKE